MFYGPILGDAHPLTLSLELHEAVHLIWYSCRNDSNWCSIDVDDQWTIELW